MSQNPWLIQQDPQLAPAPAQSTRQRIGLSDWKFSYKSMTFVLTLTQFIIFFFENVKKYNKAIQNKIKLYTLISMSNYNCVLYHTGAKFAPSIRYHYQFQRLLTPVLLHSNILHIFGNFQAQILYGFMHENQYGTNLFAIIYSISAINGNLLRASSAIFGLFGLEIVQMILRLREVSLTRFLVFLYVVGTALIGLFDMTSTNIDVSAHVGGLITGVCLGIVVQKRQDFLTIRRYQLIALGVILVFDFLCFGLLYKLEIYDLRFPC